MQWFVVLEFETAPDCQVRGGREGGREPEGGRERTAPLHFNCCESLTYRPTSSLLLFLPALYMHTPSW